MQYSMERGKPVRQFWIDTMVKITEPLLSALAEDRLLEVFPKRKAGAYFFSNLEGCSRVLAGIAPWLEVQLPQGEEKDLQQKFRVMAREGVINLVNPQAKDYADFLRNKTQLVHAAYLANAFYRAPKQLWEPLPSETKQQLLAAFQESRKHRPDYSNWLLFSAIIETFLCSIGEAYDITRIEYALRSHDDWYVGDGAYGDGPEFAWDYYNSFVIQPMMMDVLFQVKKELPYFTKLYKEQLKRGSRYAQVLERMIGPDGTYPLIGRSLTYRFGAFQHLGHLALHGLLPKNLAPNQIRSAMTAVIEKTMENPNIFDANGWLTMGVYGEQDKLGEYYLSIGSQYFCCMAFLPLGLPPKHRFWKAPYKEWTGLAGWTHGNIKQDHFLRGDWAKLK